VKDNGGPAFPHDGQQNYTGGATLRDYFAAKAMQGIISASGDNNGHVDYHEDWVAKNAYKMADAMLKAREAE